MKRIKINKVISKKETTEKELIEFKKYIKSQREEFVLEVLMYSPRTHTKLRTVCDSLIIAYDQMAERLSKQETFSREDVEQRCRESMSYGAFFLNGDEISPKEYKEKQDDWIKQNLKLWKI